MNHEDAKSGFCNQIDPFRIVDPEIFKGSKKKNTNEDSSKFISILDKIAGSISEENLKFLRMHMATLR